VGGTITAMRLQARNKTRVVVYLDGQGTLGLAKAVASRLAVGQALTDEEIEGLRKADTEEDAYQRGLRLISLRPRSEREIRLHYDRYRIPGEVQEGALARLREVGLIDDTGFARQWVENRQALRPRSSLALRSELQRRRSRAPWPRSMTRPLPIRWPRERPAA
jgi:regulatory protein